ncbi:MAG: transposase [Chlamydiia bacterium]|nr:transposase [Chlamydiia bacterium]
MTYDHYIAVDWAHKVMAIARMTSKSERAKVFETQTDVRDLQLYLKKLQGKKILAVEEMHTSQWLYTELKPYVNELIICDPYRNRLLIDGPKTDKIDAVKLCKLLRAGMMKPIFHSGDKFIYLRKLISAYDDVVKAGVRLQNQRSAIFRSTGKNVGEKLDNALVKFVLEGLEEGITRYETEKERYIEKIKSVGSQHKILRRLKTIPGIGPINAIKIAALVVDPKRFPSKGHFLSYCGLIKLEKMSGGRSYGKKRPRYSRAMKSVYKTAAVGAIREDKNNPIKKYFDYLINEKNYTEKHAKNAAARRIAILSLGVWKSEKNFLAYKRSLKKCKAGQR